LCGGRTLAAMLIRAFGIVVGAALILNILGVVRIPGGPLAHEGWLESPLLAYDRVNLTAIPATAVDGFRAGAPLYMTVDVRSHGPIDVSLDAVEALGRDESVEVRYLGVAPSWPADDGMSIGSAAEIPDAWIEHLGRPLAGTIVKPGEADPQYVAILLSLTTEGPGEHDVGPFAVDYRMGPFTFRSIYPVSYVLCAGAPGEAFVGECPEATTEE
jgi:hypothetical protein